MTIQGIITRGKGSTHGWRVERGEHIERDSDWATLVHYATPLLRWNVKDTSEYEVLSIGHGSVSDQNGMNTAFRALDIPLRYDRDQRGGGPRVSELTRHDCGHVTDPAVDHRTCPVLLNAMLTAA